MIKQVKFQFYDEEKNEIGGIMLDNGDVICGCCGGLYEAKEVEIIEILPWIDISDIIIGE